MAICIGGAGLGAGAGIEGELAGRAVTAPPELGVLLVIAVLLLQLPYVDFPLLKSPPALCDRPHRRGAAGRRCFLRWRFSAKLLAVRRAFSTR
jgi:hypothetical protein